MPDHRKGKRTPKHIPGVEIVSARSPRPPRYRVEPQPDSTKILVIGPQNAEMDRALRERIPRKDIYRDTKANAWVVADVHRAKVTAAIWGVGE